MNGLPIAGMTINELAREVFSIFPDAVLGEDTDGNLIIHLNHYNDSNIVTPFADNEDN